MERKWKDLAVVLVVLLAAMFMTTGCAKNSLIPTMGDSSTEEGALPPVSSFADELQDIEIPVDLEWDREKSMAIKTESFRGGIWVYNGRVDAISLKDFMISAMNNSKWKLVGEVTSEEILLAFIKPNKNCMMVISDSFTGKTELTLYVTIDETAAVGLNPFGEAVQ